MHHSPESLYILIFALAAAGGMIGILAGLLGIGGGAILVPVLYQLFTYFDVPEEFRMHLCVGTSFAVMIPTALQSFRKHLKKGAVDVPLLKAWAPSMMIGVLAGWAVARYAPSETLRGAFAMVALLLALKMLFGRDSWRLGDEMPKRPALDAWGAGIGLISSLIGLGGGIFTTTLMTLYNKPIHKAIATSSAVAVIISLPGFLGYMIIGMPHMQVLPFLSVGYVNFLAVALITPFSIMTAPLGVRLAHKLPQRRLEQVFAIMLMLVSARFFSTLM